MFKVITSSVAPTLTSRSKILAFRVDNQGNDLDRSKSVGITLDPSYENEIQLAFLLHIKIAINHIVFVDRSTKMRHIIPLKTFAALSGASLVLLSSIRDASARLVTSSDLREQVMESLLAVCSGRP